MADSMLESTLRDSVSPTGVTENDFTPGAFDPKREPAVSRVRDDIGLL